MQFTAAQMSHLRLMFQRALVWRGVWSSGAYPSGSIVIHEGDIWVSFDGSAIGDVPGVSRRWGALAQRGAPGPGIAEGGTPGQLLTKAHADNFVTMWVDPPEFALPVGVPGSMLYFDDELVPAAWAAAPQMRWEPWPSTSDGRVVLDFGGATPRDGTMPMPGIAFLTPGGLNPGLFLGVDVGGGEGARVDVGWGAFGGAHCELYSATHPVRMGDICFVYGGQLGSGSTQFVRSDGIARDVVGGVSPEGRFVCGLRAGAFPGSQGSLLAAPEHPLQVYNEGEELRGCLSAKGELMLIRGAETGEPADPPPGAFVMWQDDTVVRIKVANVAGTSVSQFVLGVAEP